MLGVRRPELETTARFTASWTSQLPREVEEAEERLAEFVVASAWLGELSLYGDLTASRLRFGSSRRTAEGEEREGREQSGVLPSYPRPGQLGKAGPGRRSRGGEQGGSGRRAVDHGALGGRGEVRDDGFSENPLAHLFYLRGSPFQYWFQYTTPVFYLNEALNLFQKC